MLQRILGGVLVLLGLVAVALGVASATVWRDSDTVVATAEPVGDGTMVVTDPGVLGLVSGDVTVSAKGAEGQPVTLVVGRDVDVLGWVGDDPYSRVTGLQDWDTLGVEAGPAETAEDAPEGEEAEESEAAPSGADPAGNDMWVAETSEEGSATLRWSDRPGRWTLLAAGVGEDAQAPTLELTWPRAVTTPYLWPAVGAGAVLVVLGGLILVLGARRARARRDDPPRGTRSGAEPTGDAPEGPDAAPGDSAEPTAPGGSSLFSSVRATEPWSPAPAAGASSVAVSEVTSDEASSASSDDDGASRSGTAEVPLAGRLLRRSRRRGAVQEEPPTNAEPDVAPAGWSASDAGNPADPAAPAWSPAGEAVPADVSHDSHDAPAPSPAEARPATGGTPYLSRRELRAREEARRASEQGGVTRMLRAITGSVPVVRPQSPETPAAPEQDMSTRAGRAAAWRATWGFGQAAEDGSAGSADDHRTTDGENR